MKTLRLLLLALPLLAACATLGVGGRGGEKERQQLFEQAFDAYSRDSIRVAQALFQRVATGYPRTHQAHESRYFMGLLSLDPRAGANTAMAEQHLTIYLADDTMQSLGGRYRREATSLLRLVRELRSPCDRRSSGLACVTIRDTTVVTETAQPAGGGVSAAELARLRRAYSERGDTIRDLRAELERIRNTLAPRRP